MIRKIKLLLTPLVWLTLLSCNANGQTNDLGRECIDKCVHLNDSSLYSFKLQVVKDSSQENTIFEMYQSFKIGEESYNIQANIDKFNTTTKIYNLGLIKNLLNDIDIDYQVLQNGFDISNKKNIWNSFISLLSPEVKSNMIDGLGDEKDSILNLIDPMGQFLQFTSPIVQIHNIKIPQNSSIIWNGYLHGEYYQINNMLIPCEFELERVAEGQFNLKTTVNVKNLKEKLINHGLIEKLLGISESNFISSTSKITGEQIETFIWKLPKLYPSNYYQQWVYSKVE